MPKTIVPFPVRACPFFDCQCVWQEDDRMYEDLNRCPACSRDVTTFSYGVNPDQGLPIPTGTRRRLFLRTETAGYLHFEDGGFIATEQLLDEVDYRG